MRKTVKAAKILKNLDPETYKMLRFGSYALIVIITSMINAVLTQKIYKTPYVRNDNEDGKTPSSDYFNNPFGMSLFNSFFALCYGFIMYQIMEHNSEYRQVNGDRADKQFMKLSVVDLVIDLLIGLMIILTSFTAVNLINCGKLLAVVLFAVFFSSASSHFKVQKRQIFVAGLISIGIVIFNAFGSHDSSSVNKPFTIWTSLLMIFLLIVQGYRPQLTSQIRDKYSPPPSLMYYQVSKYSFIFLTILSIVSMKGWQLITFLWSHDRLALDLMMIAVLEVISMVFVYRITVLHQQHVMPMISTIRKLLTSVFNIYYFHHNIEGMQYLGLTIVAITILIQLYVSYRANREKFNEIKAQDQPYFKQ